MSRLVWWFLAVAASGFTVWNGSTLTMFDVSTSCSKVGESSSYQCSDSAVEVLGIWPLVSVGLLLATPPAVAAITMRKQVSWCAVAALVALFGAAVFLVTYDGYWKLLMFALPMAVLGSIVAAFQPSVPRQTAPGLGGELTPAWPSR